MDYALTSYVVTGGAGFIGSHLVELLLTKKDTGLVYVIDNFVTGKRDNITRFQSDERLVFIECDLSKKETLPLLLEKITSAQYIIHLAALSDVVPSVDNPVHYIKNNVDCTLNILELSRKIKNLKKIIYAASSSCYGDNPATPTHESDVINCKYPYALSKYLSEEIIQHWSSLYGIPYLSLRLFNVYGPRSSKGKGYGAVINVFMAQKMAGLPLTIIGDGEQKRDFVHVRDVANAFYMASTNDCVNEVVNIGAGRPRSINELAKLLDHDVQYIPDRPGEPRQTYSDISKAHQLLNWSPNISLEEGINSILECADDWREEKAWSSHEIDLATNNWHKLLS